MVTVASLYICISHINTYSYNFYSLSFLHSYCMSIFFVTCSMSLAYLLSILLLYSCFYTLHIPYSFYNLLFFMFYYIFFHILLYFYILLYFSCVHLSCLIISHIHTLLSWFYTIPFVIFYFHVLLSCTVFIYCFLVILFILLSLLGTVLVHILFVSLTIYFLYLYCETPENPDFLRNVKMVILVKIRNFSRSRMTKRTSSLESSHEI